MADGVAIGHVGADEPELANLAERLDEVGVARLAGDDPGARAGLEQLLANVAADEAAAAENRHELGIEHRVATSRWCGALTRRPPHPAATFSRQ
jgi:hypothetical protein